MIYSKEYETMSRDDLEQLQVERLQVTLNRVYRNVLFYKNLYDEKGIDISDIRSVCDLSSLPFTTKDDLRKSYPYEAFAVPLRDIVRIHSTSGTTGTPIVVGYTRNDLKIWSGLVARILSAAELNEKDLVQIAFNYSQSTGGLGFHYGAEQIGASVIPASGEEVMKQIQIMKDYRSSALVSTPGYALHIISVLEEHGIDPGELNLSTGLFGSEPWSEKLRKEIESRLKITSFDNYGLSEIIGPGVAFECREHNGLHVNEDHFIVEVIDPVSLKVLADGEEGELVFTTITKQGFPLIRYRTGDISSILEGSCGCGRTTRRIKRISGRSDDMMIVDGNNLFPSQIESLLFEIEGVEPHFQIIMDRKEGLDVIEIKVEVSSTVFAFDEIRKVQKFQEKIRQQLITSLGLHAKIRLVEPKSLGRSTGTKIKRVLDKRTL
ncbi:MAG: phenylacetate--CoA ligase [Spirochaetaceae bacterium]|nr:phenylacetate--CoA ligase [Spirochaetaceae bacterium]